MHPAGHAPALSNGRVSTWAGFVFVAFAINVSARRIEGWKVSSSARTDLVLDAPEQTLYARRREADQSCLIHYPDRSVHVSIGYTERVRDAGIEPSVGGVGDSYDCKVLSNIAPDVANGDTDRTTHRPTVTGR